MTVTQYSPELVKTVYKIVHQLRWDMEKEGYSSIEVQLIATDLGHFFVDTRNSLAVNRYCFTQTERKLPSLIGWGLGIRRYEGMTDFALQFKELIDLYRRDW